MKQEDWTKKLRERLSDYEQPAPADAWEQIERRLPASVPPVRTALHRWLAAAAAVTAPSLLTDCRQTGENPGWRLPPPSCCWEERDWSIISRRRKNLRSYSQTPWPE